MPFTSSRAYSAGAVAPVREAPPWDVSTPEGVAAAASRAFKGDLIVFQFETRHNGGRFFDFALNLAAQLDAAGFHHYVALGAFPYDCEVLHSRWRELFPQASAQPSCVVATWPFHGVPEGGAIAEGMWIARYQLVADLVAQGLSGVMMLDADTAIHRDPYADLDAPCFQNTTMVVLAEGGGPNGGFFYARNAHPEGATHWVLSQPARRWRLFMEGGWKPPEGGPPGPTMDQSLIKDAVRVVVMPTRGSHWDLGHERNADHPFWKAHPEWAPEPEPKEQPRDVDTPSGLECPGAERWRVAGPTGEKHAEWYGLRNRANARTALYKPADAPGALQTSLPQEWLLWAPSYFISFGEIAAAGWQDGVTPASALTHMLTSRACWRLTTNEAHDFSGHAARQAYMQVHHKWAPQLTQRRAGDAALLFLAEAEVAAAVRHRSPLRLRALVAHGLRAAAATGRLLVLPHFLCADAPWVAKNERSLTGILDERLLVTGPPSALTCHPGPHPGTDCWAWRNLPDHPDTGFLVHGFDAAAIARRPAAAAVAAGWTAEGLRAQPGDVVVEGVDVPPLLTEGSPLRADVARVEKVCWAFFHHIDPTAEVL